MTTHVILKIFKSNIIVFITTLGLKFSNDNDFGQSMTREV
jgi:hypothetical protein